MATVKGSKTPQDERDATGGDSLEKVREILFGTQARESESRFSRLEERLLKVAAELRTEIQGRFDSLQQYVRSELEVMAQKLQEEAAARRESIKQLSDAIGEASESHEKQVLDLDTHSREERQAIRSELVEQAKALRDEQLQHREELSATHEQSLLELRGDKIDHATLARLLTELALQLKNDAEPSDED